MITEKYLLENLSGSDVGGMSETGMDFWPLEQQARTEGSVSYKTSWEKQAQKSSIQKLCPKKIQ